ncbi:MAG: SpoIIE family protein phosphatase [Bacteroidetes bacterium]|nr:SpoIIE family protein phosphatase [Bacteroidota bacterium]
MKKTIAILLWLLFPCVITSQTYYFESYGVRHGLAQSNVAATVQDANGYYWLATESGLSKFDGKNFTNYTTENGLADNNITGLLIDKNKTLWLTHDNGLLTSYNNNQFKTHNVKEIGTGKKIYCVTQDSKGHLWLGTNNGAFEIPDPGNLNKVKSFSASEGLSPIVFSIQENANGDIWFLTDIGLKKLDKQNGKIEFVKFSDIPPVQITAFQFLKSGDVVIGTSTGSIYKAFANSKAPELLFDIRSHGFIGSFASNFIYTIYEDSKSNIWASVFNSGVCKIDNNQKVLLFTVSNGLPVNKIKSINEDREGNILLGTVGEGLQVFKGAQFVSYSKNNGMSNSQVYGICTDNNGEVWLATNEGISVINSEGKIDNISEFPFSPVTNTRALTKDKSGNIYVALWGGKVAKFNTGSKKATPLAEVFELINPFVSALMIDHNNVLWIGTIDGLTTYNCSTGETKSLRTVDGLSGNDIACLFEDSKKRVWVGTKQKGITLIEGNKFTILNKEKGISNNVTSVNESQDGTIWIGTENNGIYAYKNGAFNNVTLKDGLISNYITLLQPSRSQELWIGTNKGLCKFNITNSKITPYLKSDGFTGIETRPNSVFIDRESNVWFGTVDGAFKYSATHDNHTQVEPLLHITSLKVNLREVSLKENLQLSYKENSLLFEFTAITLKHPEEISYKIKLEGYDSDWRPATRENYVSFSNLPAGHYSFKIQACVGNNCTQQNLNYTFIIAPPFWKTWWFYVIVVVSITALLFAYIKIRERQLKKENKILEEKVKERTAEVVQKNIELDEKNKDITASIRYAKRIQDAILPPDFFVRNYLPKTFILFKPKDIVSGDFYWLYDKKDMVLFAAVDCTGHGVPGAFMSIVGHSKLDQIVAEHGITKPSEILNELNKNVSDTLRQSYLEDNQVRDGMDIALCAFNRKTNVLEYAGAFNPLWLIRNGELTEIKADKFPIGNLKSGENKKFTNHSIQLIAGDTLYIYSDGFADQFGGPDGKKFKYSAFKKLLLDTQHLSMEEQGELLYKTIEEWKGELEQVDDILVIGTRL